jgi:hypothetical protein
MLTFIEWCVGLVFGWSILFMGVVLVGAWWTTFHPKGSSGRSST